MRYGVSLSVSRFALKHRVMCLQSQLSDSCKTNLENGNESSSSIPSNFIQQRSKQLTIAITVLAITFLTVPLCGFLWAALKLRSFSRLCKPYPERFLGGLEASDANPYAYDNALSMTRSNGGECNSEPSNRCAVSFLHLNYWVRVRATLQAPWHAKKKQILQDITALLDAGTLTAIMGPSGKSTPFASCVLSEIEQVAGRRRF
jgi:ABC-type multidrug transport system fused ATPase/permease subunit